MLLFPLHLPKLIRRGGFGRSLWQRFGYYQGTPKTSSRQKRLWLQVVSVGEAQVAVPLIQALRDRSDCFLFVTTTTSTAHALLIKRFGHCARIWIGYFPFDFYFFITNALRRVRPDLIVLFESELWPELLHCARVNKIPVWLANARHSDKTMARFSRFPWIARWLYACVAKAMFVSAKQANDLASLSIVANSAKVLGQLKLDVSLPVLSEGDHSALLASMRFHNLSKTTCIMMGASIWPGEESILLDALIALLDQGVDVRLVLVPRHADRGVDIARIVEGRGLSYSLRSQGATQSEDVLVHIADTTGELQSLCQCAHVALVGKSFKPHVGGQNPLEMIAAGVSVVYGPRMTNFYELCQDLECHELVRCCQSVEDAIQQLIALVNDAPRRIELSHKSQHWLRDRQGVLARVLDEFDGFLRT